MILPFGVKGATMRTTVFSSIIKRILFQRMLSAFIVIAFALTLFPLSASADEDPCRKTGICILNMIQLGSWVRRNEGPCSIWHRNYLMPVKPGDVLIIYSDMECQKEYYSKTPAYEDYKSFDANQDCRVKILPDRTIEDL
jgi:hypothetical protein